MNTATQAPKKLHIPMIAVESSQIKQMGYSPEHQVLRIVFQGRGPEYDYPNFTQAEFDAFKGAETLGTYFHKHIKPRTDFIKHPPHKA